jgi:hypothetical protein
MRPTSRSWPHNFQPRVRLVRPRLLEALHRLYSANTFTITLVQEQVNQPSLRVSNGGWFIWSISSVWFVWLVEPEIHPEEPDRPANQTDEPVRVARARKIISPHPLLYSNLEYFLLLGTAPAVVQLRPSSEHIPIVRAPGARDHAGVVPSPPLESSF